MDIPDGQVFTEETFFSALCRDLQGARCRVLIQSPFLAENRIGLLANTLRQVVNRGVTLCTFVQEPDGWRRSVTMSEPKTYYRLRKTTYLMHALESMGVHVTLKQDAHEKLAVIDDSILWEGSLNILSHRKTSERMRRWTNRTQVREAVRLHHLDECAICLENHSRYGLGSVKLAPPAVGAPLLVQRLTERRAMLKLSQAEIADKCGTTQSVISRIEVGKSSIKLVTFLELAAAVELEPILVPRLLVPSVTRLLRSAAESSEGK